VVDPTAASVGFGTSVGSGVDVQTGVGSSVGGSVGTPVGGGAVGVTTGIKVVSVAVGDAASVGVSSRYPVSIR
jgi:hypothetical protein